MPENDTQALSPQTTFRDLALIDEVQQAVEAAGYETPTPIQSQIIPQMLAGRDLLAQSQTGTGKTAAFALPILSQIKLNQRAPQALVLTPTRELAIQVAKSFSTYAACLPGFSASAIYGGQDYEPQLKQLRRGVPVVVGTPGRVIDHIKRGTLDLSSIECLVLDEADEMLNMGFLEDVQFVLDRLPEQRQIALFSATLPAPIRAIAQKHLNDPVKISIKTKTMTVASIRQRALFVTPHDKVGVLTRMLEVEATDGVIVFTKTKDATITVADALRREGLAATALNGDMPQKVRERTIAQLKAGQLDVLVATDVAARGLDVTRISHVFNFDMPHDSESYVHRVGRTGRAGRNGEAVLFLTRGQRGKLKMIEKTTKQPIELVEPPSADTVNAVRIERFKQRITDVTAEQDLTMFKDLITQYAEESGKPLEMIAAALAQLGQQGRSFFAKELPRGKSHDRDEKSFPRKSGNKSGPQARRPKGSPLGTPEAGMNRYRIEVGRKDGVKPGNIVGAVANEAGIDSEFIGPIKIHDSHSTVDLPEGMPKGVYQTLKRTWVVGKQLQLTAAKEGDDQTQARSGGSSRKGKPRRAKGEDRQGFARHNGPHAGKQKKRKVKAKA